MGSKRSVWCGAAFKEWQEALCSIRSDTILREPAHQKKAPAGTGAFSITEQGYGRLRSNNSGRSASRKGSVWGLFGRYPAEGLSVVGDRLPGKFGDMEEMEPHRAEIVIVLNRAPEPRVADG